MAGLTRSVNIVTSKNRAMPNWPRPYMPSESWPFYGSHNYGAPNSDQALLPGFLNFGSVGSSISINGYNSTSALKMFNGQGTQQTASYWNGGLLPTEFSADYDTWAAVYMDRSDNKLYLLMMDTSTSPDTYIMGTVDKDGNIAFVTAAFQVTSTALNAQNFNYDSTPSLYRVGGVDGTGNFRFDKWRANTPNDNSTQPYDGVRLEINTSSGTVNGISANTMAETTDGLVPNNIFLGSGAFNPATFLGPTDNGIIGSVVYADYRYNEGQVYGSLGNANTGQINMNVMWGQDCPFFRWNTGYFKPVPWLGSYMFIPLDQANLSGFSNFSRTDMHAFMDEMAVRNGLL
jgi:hypothetical protein